MARAIIDAKLLENPVMVFSKSYCPFCTKAKKALAKLLKTEQFTVMEVSSLAYMHEQGMVIGESGI